MSKKPTFFYVQKKAVYRKTNSILKRFVLSNLVTFDFVPYHLVSNGSVSVFQFCS